MKLEAMKLQAGSKPKENASQIGTQVSQAQWIKELS